MIPEEIQNFIRAFSRLPSMGPRQATRLAFFLTSLDAPTLRELEHALGALGALERCGECFFLKRGNDTACALCTDPRRTTDTIVILEKETDLLTFEKMGTYKGKYLVLGRLAERGILEPAQKSRLEHLKRALRQKNVLLEELIIALNPSSIGDFTADLIAREFKDLAKKITRLGRGIPTGGEIEFADDATLAHAFERRN